MNIFGYLRRRQSATACVAKERLQIIIAHERSQRDTPDYLPRLKDEILAVIAKYVAVSHENVHMHLERIGDSAVLELNITMPDKEEVK